MTGSHDLINSMYPKYDKWIEIYEKLNKNGTFDSPFTKRVGFSKETFAEILWENGPQFSLMTTSNASKRIVILHNIH